AAVMSAAALAKAQGLARNDAMPVGQAVDHHELTFGYARTARDHAERIAGPDPVGLRRVRDDQPPGSSRFDTLRSSGQLQLLAGADEVPAGQAVERRETRHGGSVAPGDDGQAFARTHYVDAIGHLAAVALVGWNVRQPHFRSIHQAG